MLAPHAKLRAAIVPSPADEPTGHAAAEHAHHTPARMSWARLLKRVFDLDIERCSNCGGSLKIIAAIEDAPVIVRMARGQPLPAHLGLPTRAPPRAPAQRVDLFQAA